MKFAIGDMFNPVRTAVQSFPNPGFGIFSKGAGLQGVQIQRGVLTVNHYLLRTIGIAAHADIFALDNKTRK